MQNEEYSVLSNEQTEQENHFQTLQQRQMYADNNLHTPRISMAQFMAYQQRQEVIENARMKATMNNMIQTFFPGSSFDANSIAPNNAPTSHSLSQVPSTLLSTPPLCCQMPTTPTFFIGNTQNAQTQRPIPLPKKGKGNFSKTLPCVAILELRCVEPKNADELCNKKVSTEEKLLEHLELKHGILKFRCLSRDCRMSFDRRKDLEAHISREHSSGLTCRHCPKQLKNSSNFEKHFKLFHQKGLYQCIQCIHVQEYHHEMRSHIRNKSCPKIGANNFVDPMRNLRSANTPSHSYADVFLSEN